MSPQQQVQQQDEWPAQSFEDINDTLSFLSVSVTQTNSSQALVPCSSPLKADSPCSSSTLTELQNTSTNPLSTSPSNTFTFSHSHGFFHDLDTSYSTSPNATGTWCTLNVNFTVVVFCRSILKTFIIDHILCIFMHQNNSTLLLKLCQLPI